MPGCSRQDNRHPVQPATPGSNRTKCSFGRPAQFGFRHLDPALKLFFHKAQQVRTTHLKRSCKEEKGIERIPTHPSLKLREVHLRESRQTRKLALRLASLQTGISDDLCQRPFQILDFFHAYRATRFLDKKIN